MSARVVSRGSQPAVEVRCDSEPCVESETVFLDYKSEARQYLSAHGWLSIQIGSTIGDFCPSHARTSASQETDRG